MFLLAGYRDPGVSGVRRGGDEDPVSGTTARSVAGVLPRLTREDESSRVKDKS